MKRFANNAWTLESQLGNESVPRVILHLHSRMSNNFTFNEAVSCCVLMYYLISGFTHSVTSCKYLIHPRYWALVLNNLFSPMDCKLLLQQ